MPNTNKNHTGAVLSVFYHVKEDFMKPQPRIYSQVVVVRVGSDMVFNDVNTGDIPLALVSSPNDTHWVIKKKVLKIEGLEGRGRE